MRRTIQFFVTLLLCGAFSLTVAAQENLIRNGDFTEPLIEQGWVSIHDIENTPGTEYWHVQVIQELDEEQLDALEEGETYTLTFDAKAGDDKDIAVYFGQDEDPHTNLLLEGNEEDFKIISLTTEEQSFSFDFDMEVFDLMKLSFEGGLCDIGYSIGNVDISIKEEEDDDNENGDDKGENIIMNGNFSPGLFDEYWTIFYADWEDVTLSVSLNDWFAWYADWEGVTLDLTIEDGWANIHNIENTPGAEIWHVQFNQQLTKSQVDTLIKGGNYTLTFDAKAEDDKDIAVFFGQDGGSFINLLKPEEGDTIINLTTDEQSFSFDFVAERFDVMKLGFEGGLSDVGYSISNVEILLEDIDTYDLTVSVDGEGTTDPEPGTYTWAAGSEIELTATAEEDYEFEKWVINGDEVTEATTTVTIEDADVEVVAHFKEEEDDTHVVDYDENTPSISAYPNPAIDRLNVITNKGANVILTNITGSVVESKIAGSDEISFNVNDLPSGIYIISVEDKGNRITKKIMVK